MANEKAPGDYRDRQATIVEHDPGTAEYTVNFDGQIICLNSCWLDPVHEDTKMFLRLKKLEEIRYIK